MKNKETQYTYKVVIVDDEKDVRETLAETLDESLRMKIVGEAHSAQSAFEEIIAKKPDLIFLDIKLQEGDAFMVLDKLISIDFNVPPIVLNTGFNDFELAQKSLNEYGVYIVSILQKPFWKDWTKKEEQIIDFMDKRRQKEIDNVLKLSNIISLQDGPIMHMLKVDNIIYITKDGQHKNSRSLSVGTVTKVVSCTDTIINIWNVLPNNFVQISRFSIINLNHLGGFNLSDSLVFMRGVDSKGLQIGRTFKSSFVETLKTLGVELK